MSLVEPEIFKLIDQLCVEALTMRSCDVVSVTISPQAKKTIDSYLVQSMIYLTTTPPANAPSKTYKVSHICNKLRGTMIELIESDTLCGGEIIATEALIT